MKAFWEPETNQKRDRSEWHCRVVEVRFAQNVSYHLPGILVKSGTRKLVWAFLPSQAILHEPSLACAVNTKPRRVFPWRELYHVLGTKTGTKTRKRDITDFER